MSVMWGLFAACAAFAGTVLQVGTSLIDVKEKHAAEIKTWNEESELMDQMSWLRHPIKKALFYLDLVRMRTDQEHRVILRVQAVLWGWIFLMLAVVYTMIDQLAALL